MLESRAAPEELVRLEDHRLVTGAGRFVDDLAPPGMLHAAVLRSPHAHARILSIDVDAARSAPGVHAVLTAADCAAAGFGPLPGGEGMKRRDGSPMYRPRQGVLAGDRVRWVGDPVAMVVAATRAQAEDAAERIEIEYEPLPAVTDVAEGAVAGAPPVWDDCPDNVCFVHRGGDAAAVERGLASAAHVVRRRLRISRVIGAAMEPRGCLGAYDPASGRYTIHAMLQRPQQFRAQLAAVMGLPEARLRVVAGDIGGSFGSKAAVGGEAPLVLLAARLTGRPVKWTATRSETFLGEPHGRDSIYEAELALDGEGRFLALRVTSLCNLGAYLQSAGETAAFINLGGLAGVYTIPAIAVDATALFTHTNPLRPYRGNGRPEATYTIERMIDLAAAELGLSPVALRRRNMIRTADLPYRTGLTFTYDCGDFERCLDLTLDMAGHGDFETRRREALARGRYRGIGVAMAIEQAASPSIASAEIRFESGGTATLYSAAVSQGQGHESVLTALLRQRLGLPADAVRYVAGDTDQVFCGEGTFGSRTASLGGSAVVAAADAVIAKAKPLAAHLLGAPVAEVAFADGLFSSPGSNLKLSLQEVAIAACRPGPLPAGIEPGLSATAFFDNKTRNFPYACHVCEVEIDPATGRLELVGYWVVHDVGVELNHHIVEGQLIGGIAQGIGQALLEEIRFDPDNGQLLSGSFLDYAMPRIDHVCRIDAASNPVPTATNPLGVKGAGESGCVGALPVVVNAIADALAPLGIRHVDMPATPERLWRAIRAATAG